MEVEVTECIFLSSTPMDFNFFFKKTSGRIPAVVHGDKK